MPHHVSAACSSGAAPPRQHPALASLYGTAGRLREPVSPLQLAPAAAPQAADPVSSDATVRNYRPSFFLRLPSIRRDGLRRRFYVTPLGLCPPPRRGLPVT